MSPITNKSWSIFNLKNVLSLFKFIPFLWILLQTTPIIGKFICYWIINFFFLFLFKIKFKTYSLLLNSSNCLCFSFKVFFFYFNYPFKPFKVLIDFILYHLFISKGIKLLSQITSLPFFFKIEADTKTFNAS